MSTPQGQGVIHFLLTVFSVLRWCLAHSRVSINTYKLMSGQANVCWLQDAKETIWGPQAGGTSIGMSEMSTVEASAPDWVSGSLSGSSRVLSPRIPRRPRL